jgi:hypothetical protein
VSSQVAPELTAESQSLSAVAAGLRPSWCRRRDPSNGRRSSPALVSTGRRRPGTRPARTAAPARSCVVRRVGQRPDAQQHGGSRKGEHARAGVLPACRQHRYGRVGEELAGVGGAQDRIPGDRSGGAGHHPRHDDRRLAGRRPGRPTTPRRTGSKTSSACASAPRRRRERPAPAARGRHPGMRTATAVTVFLVMVTMVAPSVGRWRKTGDARQSSQGQRRGEGGRTVVFVHPHGASKSRIAAAWLESDERARPVTFNPVRRLVSDPPSPVAPTLSNRGSAAAVVVGQVVRRLPAGPAATAADRGPRPPQRRERASSTPSAQPIAALPPSPSSASRCTPIRRQVAAVSTTSPFPHHDHSV